MQNKTKVFLKNADKGLVESIFGGFMFRIFLIFILISLSNTLYAGEWKLLDVDEISVDAYKVGFYRNPYWDKYDEKIDRGFNVNVNLRAMKYVFYEGQFQMTGTEGQLRQGGLRFRAGVNVSKYMDFAYWHYSDHLLDDGPVYQDQHFPIMDAYGVRFFFFKKSK